MKSCGFLGVTRRSPGGITCEINGATRNQSAHLAHEGAPASAADLGQGPRVCLYRDLDPEGSGDVPDPWYGGHQDFLDTLEVIERVTPQILALVR